VFYEIKKWYGKPNYRMLV